MKATIQQINKTVSGFQVVCEIEGRNPRIFDFTDTDDDKKVKKTIEDYLTELKVSEGTVPDLKKKLLGTVIEV